MSNIDILDYNDITSLYWQIKLNGNGEILENLDDIKQSIYIILTTQKGSDPHRPLFGSDIYKYIDNPVNSAVPDIIREATDAIRAWEPRIEVLSITPTFENEEKSHVKILVEWKVKNYDEIQITEVMV